jgi:hypothetical protein
VLILSLPDWTLHVVFVLGTILSVFIYVLRLNLGRVRHTLHFFGDNRSNPVSYLLFSPYQHYFISFGILDFVYCLIAFICPSWHCLMYIEIINIILLVCFVIYLIQPYSTAIDIVVNYMELKEHELKFKELPWWRRCEPVCNWLLPLSISQKFLYDRADVYRGFMEFETKQDIISYLQMIHRKTKHKKAAYLSSNENNAIRSKIYSLVLLLVLLVSNYIALNAGVRANILGFNGNISGYIKPLYFLLTTFTTVGYGDVTPYAERDFIIVTMILVQVLLFILVLINVINDLSSSSSAKLYKPFIEFCDFLLDEINTLIHQVETDQFDDRLDELMDKFKKLEFRPIYNKLYFYKNKCIRRISKKQRIIASQRMHRISRR